MAGYKDVYITFRFRNLHTEKQDEVLTRAMKSLTLPGMPSEAEVTVQLYNSAVPITEENRI